MIVTSFVGVPSLHLFVYISMVLDIEDKHICDTVYRLCKGMETSFSDSELDKMDLESSLCNHSHFFAFSPHRRYSIPILDDSASPVPLIRTNGSVERLECLEGVLEGSRYENKDSLAHDLSFLATMPELCDVTFLVGEDRQPVCGVRAILAARSR